MNKKPRFGSDLGNGITPFVVLSSPATYKHQIYIHNNLEQPDELVAILDVLYSASEDDQVIIHLNSGGGSIYSLDTLLSAIASCPAHIHVIATGNIASAATFILLSADSFEISPYASLLFHACSFGVYGESQDNIEYVQFVHKENERLMRDYYSNLFTEDEINDIIINKRQKWLTSDEFSERFEKAKKLSEKQHKEAVDKAQQDFLASMEADELPEAILKKLTKLQLIAYIQGDIIVDVAEDGETFEIIEIEDEEAPKLH